MEAHSPLTEFIDQPPPAFAEVNSRKQGYRDSVPIDLECSAANERCIDVRDIGIAGHNHYNTASNPPYFVQVPGSVPQLWLREGVVERLQKVNTRLKPAGLELYLFDAWRPQAIQSYFHGTWFPAWLRENRPELSDEELSIEVESYWAAPSKGESSPSPHSTGGAVDLTLRFLDTGQPIYMGGIFDDLTENAHTDWFERTDASSMSDHIARTNRRLLYNVMSSVGFANNPTEWWHYSFGDQMWAKLTGAPAALYAGWLPPAHASNEATTD